jgi:FKBP-type peptidyl-prolyl cis-trans isomerase SlyD
MELPKISSDKVVELAYQLFDLSRNNEMIERMTAEYPLQFLFNSGKMLSSFETQLEGLMSGDTFDFDLEVEEAYGAYDDTKLKQVFKDELTLNPNYPIERMRVGDRVQLEVGGQRHAGILKLVTEKYLVVDQNHFLAGKRLRFRGTILFVRKASIEELLQKRFIPSDGIRF